MRKALSLFLAVALVGSLFVGGVAAHDTDYHDKKKDDKKKKEDPRKKKAGDSITQKANSQVWQSQHVNQQNFNSQNAAAVSVSKYTKKGGDASVSQSSVQVNSNAQVANSEAENSAE